MVHGAMRLFTEFVRNDLSEDQLLPVMRELVPVLLTILGDSKVGEFACITGSLVQAVL